MTLSIVVPTLREAHNVPALAEHLRAVAPDAEVLLVDGDSDDGTADVARQHGLRVVKGCRGRWRQMNYPYHPLRPAVPLGLQDRELC